MKNKLTYLWPCAAVSLAEKPGTLILELPNARTQPHRTASDAGSRILWPLVVPVMALSGLLSLPFVLLYLVWKGVFFSVRNFASSDAEGSVKFLDSLAPTRNYPMTYRPDP
jgi:hypothetical protein